VDDEDAVISLVFTHLSVVNVVAVKTGIRDGIHQIVERELKKLRT
jgi:phosphatidylethanolamine-binding protein (PEBP) family uncharacterized protein